MMTTINAEQCLEWFRLSVPLNEKGEYELMHYGLGRANCRLLHLTKNECKRLFPLFDEYNDRFDIIIDWFEDEILPAERMTEALDMAKHRLSECSDPVEKHGLETLIEALSLAAAHHTFMDIDFGG